MRRCLFHLSKVFWWFLFCAGSVQSADLNYYLPKGTEYDPKITRPAEALGYEVGDWHVRHDQLVGYLKQLAWESDRIQVETIGRTYEERELVLLTVSAPENLARIDKIREEHLSFSRPWERPERVKEQPVVIYMGYSVHGDESSGGNAALLVAYHLAAAQGSEMDELLARAVILLDPCLNPDGFSRFAQWANSHRGEHPVGDEHHREHWAVWPRGRGNHYWFDLNRDWLLLQHPESQARIRKFHEWKPNVLTDFHEMGSDATYFFQPGVPERKNPLTPERNVRLTERFAAFHARALDAIGSLYYTEERFDDYYYGKGSTYPDLNGAIGILFEQASTRGHLRESPHGEFDFPFTIRNQFRTSLSTFQAALRHRVELLKYQREFYERALEAGRQDPVNAYVFGDGTDRGKNWHLLDVLIRHGIEVRELADWVHAGDRVFEPGSAYLVPMEQPQYWLAKTIFEKQTEFPDNVFYDVSAWTLPLAMGVPYQGITNMAGSWVGERVATARFPEAPPVPDGRPYAYVFDWKEHYAPRALYRLLEAEVRVKVVSKPLKAKTPSGELSLARGSIVIPMGIQEKSRVEIRRVLERATALDAVAVHSVSSGLTPAGIDLGSPSLRSLEKPVPLVVVGEGVSPYEAGEVWHLLDRRFDIKVALVEMDALGRLDWHRYTHLIMVQGGYSRISKAEVERIKDWIRRGGVLIAIKSAVQWAADQKLAGVEFVKDRPEAEDGGENEKKDASSEIERRAYADYEKIEDAKRLSGAFFLADLDVTHPVAYGYESGFLPLLRNSRLYMKPSKNPYGTVARYTEAPVLSGYIHEEELEKLRNSAAIIAEKHGEGAVILMVDNPNFRAYTHGSTKLFLNALFFGPALKKTGE